MDCFLNMLLYIYIGELRSIYMISIFGWVESVKIIFLSYFLWNQFSVWLLIPMFLYYLWKECVCMSVCLHRYFSHKGFHVHRFTQFIMGIMSCLALQGPPIWWASKHRRHHKHCDTIKDPHSPIAFSKLYAWVGWGLFGNRKSYRRNVCKRFDQVSRTRIFRQIFSVHNLVRTSIVLVDNGGSGVCIHIYVVRVIMSNFNIIF